MFVFRIAHIKVDILVPEQAIDSIFAAKVHQVYLFCKIRQNFGWVSRTQSRMICKRLALSVMLPISDLRLLLVRTCMTEQPCIHSKHDCSVFLGVHFSLLYLCKFLIDVCMCTSEEVGHAS